MDGYVDGWMGGHRGKTGSDESTGVTGAAP